MQVLECYQNEYSVTKDVCANAHAFHVPLASDTLDGSEQAIARALIPVVAERIKSKKEWDRNVVKLIFPAMVT